MNCETENHSLKIEVETLRKEREGLIGALKDQREEIANLRSMIAHPSSPAVYDAGLWEQIDQIRSLPEHRLV